MNTSTSFKLTSQKPPKLNTLTQQKLLDYFNNTWELYELLFSSIKSDDTLYLSPDPLRNPLIFYLGHTAAFYINKFKMAGLIQQGVNDRYDQLFAVGVDPDKAENLEVSSFWPSVEEVRQYRKVIYQIVLEVIQKVDLQQQRISWDHPYWAILMGIEHDRIHFETSSMLIRQLEVDLVERPLGWEYAPSFGNPPKNEWIEMERGHIQFGKAQNCNLFGWDNEYGSKCVKLAPFKATKNLISNAEYLEFVRTNAYQDKAFWTNEGWEWKTSNQASHPKFWLPKGKNFKYRAMFDEVPLPLDWPVEINAHEAWAYCNWKKDDSRLLSEAEFIYIARENTAEDYDPVFSSSHNLDFKYGSPSPVGYMKMGATASGFNDIYGNVWDWLKDDFHPLEGFKTHPYYEDFSLPFMDEEHSMLAGGAWATTGAGASKNYRLWFRRHFFQHAGFRLAKSI